MKKIIVPQKAIKCHEETLGEALFVYLKYLSEGSVLTWRQEGREKQYQATTPCSKDYWKWVYEEFKDKHILTASPMELIRFAKQNDQRVKQVGGWPCSKSKELQDEIISFQRKALFNFDKLRSGCVLAKASVDDDGKVKILWSTAKENLKKWKGWSLAEYFRLLDIRYCPYCNAESVGLVKRTWPEGNDKDSYSAIDHILPKDTYPLLALSLCNLVPVCYKCNSQFKRNTDSFRIKDWSQDMPLLALHPYVHNVHKWFRFKYEPSSVENMFVREEDNSSPLSAEPQDPLPVNNMKEHSDEHKNLFLKRIQDYLKVFELQNSYRDLYAKEINAILKYEMICTREFEAEMKHRYGLSDEDFDLDFRRTSLDPRKIDQYRFAKLTIDLVKQFRQDVSRPRIISAWKKWWRQRKRGAQGRILLTPLTLA